MQKARHCLSLLAVAALTCGLGGNVPIGPAHAENGLSAPGRITAIYRVELAGFNLGDFRLTTTFRGDDYEMRGEGRFSVLRALSRMARGHGRQRARDQRRARACDVRAELFR